MPYYAPDSREMTNYSPNCQVNEDLKQQFGLKNELEYRLYLQRNGNSVLQYTKFANTKDNCQYCPVCEQAVAWMSETPK